ncbi:hypothetical protein ACHAQH_008231 [Verticillium albo-atrum]
MDGLERFQGLKRALTPPIPPLDEVEGPQSLHLEQAKSEVFVLSDPISLLDDDLKMATRAVLEAESPPETTRVTMPSTPPEPEALPSTLPSYVRMFSPSTGILITTLLKIRQKPLPGTDVAVSPLRKRINNVALLYERLVIIVWQDGKDDITARAPLSPGEAAAYSDFVKQNAILQGTKIEPVYVGGGPGHLVARTIAKVRQYISCDVQHLLKEEETEWEVFFRQAGMNIYAAQVLIASLRKNFGDQGLERFLQMPLVEKMERFQGLLGGSVVLGRVSASLEKR